MMGDMHRTTSGRAVAGVSLLTVLAATVLVLGAGLAVKLPCATGNWSDGRQYRRLCYSDIVPLYGTEHLTGGRLPYLDPCPADAGTCDEYPVLTMYFMRAAAWTTGRYGGFFAANIVGLSVCGLLIAGLLWSVVGARALYFAAAPTLVIYGFMNWDLLAVALATAGTVAFLRKRDGWSGVLLGLGAAAKFYPGLLVVPFALQRLHEARLAPKGSDERRDALRRAGWLAGGGAGAWLAVNVPFALGSPHAWSTFFRFNADRPVDWDSLWFTACQRLHHDLACSWQAHTVNAASALLFVALAAFVYLVKKRRDPSFARWTFCFPLVALFLLSNKVYSPQYGLWLLPLFALALPSPWVFGAFSLADAAVFVTRFTFFGRLSAANGDPALAGYHGAPLGAFELATVIRAAVLLVAVGMWAWDRPRPERAVRLERAGPAVTAAVAT